MTLAQRRILKDFEDNAFPALKTRVEEAAGFAVPIEVQWDTLAVPNEERLYDESWRQIYFEPLIAGLKEVGRDQMGKDALKSGVQKIVIQNVKGCLYGDCWATLAAGTLTLDHESVQNAHDVDARTKGLIAVLENGL
jgi:hypothetical protein